MSRASDGALLAAVLFVLAGCGGGGSSPNDGSLPPAKAAREVTDCLAGANLKADYERLEEAGLDIVAVDVPGGGTLNVSFYPSEGTARSAIRLAKLNGARGIVRERVGVAVIDYDAAQQRKASNTLDTVRGCLD